MSEEASCRSGGGREPASQSRAGIQSEGASLERGALSTDQRWFGVWLEGPDYRGLLAAVFT